MPRQMDLLELIVREGKISVLDLSSISGVSQVTIRKDLEELSKKGLITREHGFAVAKGAEDISNRLSYKYSIKSRIAKKAASLVNEGETVMIESGSCCALLAEELAKTKRDISIITNSSFIAGYIREYPNVTITLLGGEYQREAQVCVGPITKMGAQQYHVGKLFAGTDGFTQEGGFTGSNLLRIDTVRSMAKSANQVILLTDSEKFTKEGLAKQFEIDEIHSIITDDKIDTKIRDFLKKRHIEVSIVK